jgi:hypothetical protein
MAIGQHPLASLKRPWPQLAPCAVAPIITIITIIITIAAAAIK